MKMVFVWVIAFLFLAIFAYVRLAPSDPVQWHVEPRVEADKTFGNGATRRVTTGPNGLRKLDSIIAGEPRTQTLAGAVQEGMVTYVTRSRLMGYPDYTTVMQSGDELLMYARSRFGRKDFGVNATRVDRWIDALTAY